VKAVFQEVGLEAPQGVQVRVVENTDQILHFTLPAKPSTDELSEDELESVAGGFIALAPEKRREFAKNTVPVVG
jgi:hypothetical protein